MRSADNGERGVASGAPQALRTTAEGDLFGHEHSERRPRPRERFSMDSFLEACGGTGPIRLEVQGGDRARPERVLLQQPFVLIGRHPRADVVLNHAGVSRRHCYLQLVAGRPYCFDLQSRTGVTFQADHLATGGEDQRELIRIGPYHVLIDASGTKEGPPPDDSREANPLSARFAKRFSLPPARLDFLRGTGILSSCTLNRVVTLIGGGAACKVRLKDEGASRHYCALVRTTQGVWYVDLLPTHGVTINGAGVRYARLNDGDELHIGLHVIRFRQEGGLPAVRGRPAGEILPAPAALKTTGALAPRVFSLPPMSIPSTGAVAPTSVGPYPTAPTSDPALRAVLDQVVSMQQQMYDQFHQVFSLLPNLIVSLNKNHVDMIRDELTQIARLTDEIKVLRERQANEAMTALPPRPAASAAPGTEFGPVMDPFFGPQGQPMPMGPEDLPPAPEGRNFESPQAIHEVVSDYLKAFEKDRQGRWDKILKLLMSNGR